MSAVREPWRRDLRSARLPDEKRRRVPGFWGRKDRRRFVALVRDGVRAGMKWPASERTA